MIYEVWIKNGIDLDYFGSREAAELYIELFIEKHAGLKKPWSREELEIREKEEPRPVVNPDRGSRDPRPWY